MVGETSTSRAPILSILRNVPTSSEIVTSETVQSDQDLIVAEKNCVRTSSEEDMDDLKAFMNEKLQFMTVRCLEQLVGDLSMSVEEIFCGSLATVSGPNVGSVGNVGFGEVDQGRTTSVSPDLISSANMEANGFEVSFHERDDVDRILQKDLSGSCVTCTLVKGLWPIYGKRCSSVLVGHEALPCKFIKFEVAGTIGALQSGNLS